MVCISVIMPVYNDADLLEKSINSVLKQSLKDIELICVNDGSTDNTLEILKNFQEKYEFIKVFNQENQGSGKARNLGMDEAKGEYIAFLDADDFFIDNNSLKELYDVAISNNANMVSGNIKLVDADDNFSPFTNLDYYESNGKILPEEYGIPWAFYKCIYKREFLSSNKIYFPDLIRGQDPVFLAEVLSKVDIIYTVSIDFYAYYYINGANQCNTFRKRYDHIKHFEYVFKYFSHPKFKNRYDDFKKKLFIFIDMMGEDGAEDTLFSIREIFHDNKILVSECEEYYYSKFFGNLNILNKLNLLESPKISVIIPVYNAEPFLDEALNSVLNQTFKNIELVCVNDGSTDNSLEMLNKFAERDYRVKVINKENGGCGSARNKSLDNARGEYVYFFDPDDYVLPNAFEELYYNALRNHSDLVMFKIARFRDGEPIDYSVPGFDFERLFPDANFDDFTFNYKDIKRYVLNASFAPWSKLYKKAFLDKYSDFRFDLHVAFDDVPFHVKTLLRASKISFVPEFFYHYRLSNPNSVNNTKSNQIDIMKICSIVERFLREYNFFDEFKNEFYEFKIMQIMNYIISCNFEEYYHLARNEFLKMDMANVNISDYFLNKYNLVLDSKSYDDLRVKMGYSPLTSEESISKQPKVSVIVPVYNTEKYVSKCLDSLINQTLEDIEILCVDDGSTDNSLDVLKEYELKDSRIKIFSKENGGAGSARNIGVENAKGEYINFIDSDDWLDLNTFEELYDKAKNEDLDILMYLLINYDENTGELYETDYYNLTCIDSKFDNVVFNYEDISDKMFDVAVSPCNKLINREFWNGLNYKFFEGVMFEDNPFFFNVFINANRMALTRKYYYYRRRREGSVMELNGDRLKDICPMTDAVVDIFIENNLQEKFKRRLTNFKFYNFKTFYNKSNEESKESYFNAMKKNCNDIRSNEILFKLFDTGLYSDTKYWFNMTLIAENYKQFDLLIENNIYNLLNNFEEMSVKNNSLENDLSDKKRYISELESKNNSLENNLLDKQKYLDDLELKINALEDNLLVNQKSLINIESKNNMLINSNSKLNLENVHNRERVDSLKKEIEYLKNCENKNTGWQKLKKLVNS